MALDEKDIQIFRTIVKEETSLLLESQFKNFKVEVKGQIEQTVADQMYHFGDKFEAKLQVIEHRLSTKIDVLDLKLSSKIDRVVGEVSDLVGESIVPHIDEHDVRITKLETKMAV